jgi:hypothetical protein
MDNEPTLTINHWGDKHWRLNGKLHRVDDPACEYSTGNKSWWLNGRLHRVDGPACEYVESDNVNVWYLYGNYYSFDDWLEANKFISEEEKLMLKLAHG